MPREPNTRKGPAEPPRDCVGRSVFQRRIRRLYDDGSIPGRDRASVF